MEMRYGSVLWIVAPVALPANDIVLAHSLTNGKTLRNVTFASVIVGHVLVHGVHLIS
jgi:hypothetical protein